MRERAGVQEGRTRAGGSKSRDIIRPESRMDFPTQKCAARRGSTASHSRLHINRTQKQRREGRGFNCLAASRQKQAAPAPGTRPGAISRHTGFLARYLTAMSSRTDTPYGPLRAVVWCVESTGSMSGDGEGEGERKRESTASFKATN